MATVRGGEVGCEITSLAGDVYDNIRKQKIGYRYSGI